MGSTASPQGTGSLSKFYTSLITNFIIGMIFFLIFLIYRRKYPIVYHPRSSSSQVKVKPPPAGKSWFGWVLRTFRYPLKDISSLIGTDQYVELKVIEFGFKIFLLQCVYNLCILVPINALSSSDCVEFDRISLSNVPEKSDYLWAHCIGIYVTTILFIYYFSELWEDILEARRKYFLENNDISCSRFVLLTDIPEFLQEEEKLREKFHQLFPNECVGTILGRNVADVDLALKKRDECYEKLESLHLNYEFHKSRDPKTKRPTFSRRKRGKFCGCCCPGSKSKGGEKEDEKSLKVVDSIDFHYKELAKKNQQLMEKVENPAEIWKPEPFGFVLFRDFRAASIARQTLLLSSLFPKVWEVVEPAQICWGNLGLNYLQRGVRRFLARLFIFWLIIFYMIPVAFVQSLTNLDALGEKLSFLSFVASIPEPAKGWIQGFLPPLILAIFFSLLPLICCWVAKLEGLVNFHKVHRSAFSKLFYFSFVNFYLISILSGAILDQISNFVKDPTSIATVLALGMPAAGTFFLNFVILLGISNSFNRLSLLVPLLKHLYMKKILNFFNIRYDPPSEPILEHFQPAFSLPQILLIILIVQSFSTQFPVILIAGIISLYIQYFAIKHQLIYYFGAEYQSGGLLFISISNQLLGALLIYQLSMIGLFGVKKSFASIVCLPTLLLTLMAYCYSKSYHRIFRYLSLEDAFQVCEKHQSGEVDAEDHALQFALKAGSSPEEDSAVDINSFKNPSLLSQPREYKFDSDMGTSHLVEPMSETDLLSSEGKSNV